MPKIKYQIFLSSTYSDLTKEREAAIKAILELGHIPVGMEMFSAADETQWELIKRQIDESDYYVVIVANKYGTTTPEGISYTEKEYDYAIAQKVPVIGFVLADSAPWPTDRAETDAKLLVALAAFKSKLKSRMVSFWTSADDLATKLLASLAKAMNLQPRPGWVRSSEVQSADILNELSRLSRENAALREREVASSRREPEELSGVLQQLEERKVDIFFFKQDGKDWEKGPQVSLLSIFKHLASSIVVEDNCRELANMVGSFYEGDGKLRVEWPVPSNLLKEWLLYLEVLKLVAPSRRKHLASDSNEYWSLTEKGKRAYASIRWHDTKPSDNSPADNKVRSR